MFINETLSGTVRDGHLFSQERFPLIVGKTRSCKTNKPFYVNDLCDCYPLTQWMWLDRFCGPKKMRTLPQFWVAFAGGRLRNSAHWRRRIWLASVIVHVLEELFKNPAVIRSHQTQSELWAVVLSDREHHHPEKWLTNSWEHGRWPPATTLTSTWRL